MDGPRRKALACEACYLSRVRCLPDGPAPAPGAPCRRCAKLGRACVPRTLTRVAGPGESNGRTFSRGRDANAVKALEIFKDTANLTKHFNSASAVEKAYLQAGLKDAPESVKKVVNLLFLASTQDKTMGHLHAATTLASVTGAELNLTRLTTAAAASSTLAVEPIDQDPLQVGSSSSSWTAPTASPAHSCSASSSMSSSASTTSTSSDQSLSRQLATFEPALHQQICDRFLRNGEAGPCFIMHHRAGSRMALCSPDFEELFVDARTIMTTDLHKSVPHITLWKQFVVDSMESDSFAAKMMQGLIGATPTSVAPDSVSWSVINSRPIKIVDNRGNAYESTLYEAGWLALNGYLNYFVFGFSNLKPLSQASQERLDEIAVRRDRPSPAGWPQFQTLSDQDMPSDDRYDNDVLDSLLIKSAPDEDGADTVDVDQGNKSWYAQVDHAYDADKGDEGSQSPMYWKPGRMAGDVFDDDAVEYEDYGYTHDHLDHSPFGSGSTTFDNWSYTSKTRLDGHLHDGSVGGKVPQSSGPSTSFRCFGASDRG